MAVAAAGACASPYCRRRPEHTVLYRLVQEHLETYLAQARDGDGDGPGVPRSAEREFRHYLTCGILADGFARARCAACGHDFLVAFSCKGRGLCPSCTVRRMAETAAHLVDHVFPPLPVRQWVLAVPKRLRWYLEREPRARSAVLHIFLRVIERHLRQTSPGADPSARFGAVSFVHRFGASLNRHVHFHCCVLDGVFAGGSAGQVQFLPAQALTPEVLAAIAAQVRQRVLRWFARSGLLEAADPQDMLTWEHGGFSLDAAVRMAGDDRAGLERLLRYCARPAFALERLTQVTPEREVYRLPKPQPDGRTALSLTPVERLDRLAALIPPPRRHRHRDHGVLAPHAPLRDAVTADGRDATATAAPAQVTTPAASAPGARTARYHWAVLLATFPLRCPRCGAELRLIAFVTAPEPVAHILTHLGEPAQPPRIAPARGPPAWDDLLAPLPDWDTLAQPAPEFQFDQRISWSEHRHRSATAGTPVQAPGRADPVRPTAARHAPPRCRSRCTSHPPPDRPTQPKTPVNPKPLVRCPERG